MHIPLYLFPPKGEPGSWQHMALSWRGVMGGPRTGKWEELPYLLSYVSSWLCTHLGCCNCLTGSWSAHNGNLAPTMLLKSVSPRGTGPGISYSTFFWCCCSWLHFLILKSQTYRKVTDYYNELSPRFANKILLVFLHLLYSCLWYKQIYWTTWS